MAGEEASQRVRRGGGMFFPELEVHRALGTAARLEERRWAMKLSGSQVRRRAELWPRAGLLLTLHLARA